MPRRVRKNAESEVAEVVDRSMSSRAESKSGMQKGTVLPENIVQFLNALPVTGDVVVWINEFRMGLQKLLGDVDRVALKVNLNCNMIEPELYAPTIELSQLSSTSVRQREETVVNASQWLGSHPAAKFVEELQQQGHQLEGYHPPDGFDYYYGDKAYLGSILLFRERVKAPISEQTRAMMATLKPFFIFVLSDVVTRHYYVRPTDRAFNQILQMVGRDANLSTQDTRILGLMLMGLSYKQAADRMDLSIDTIRKHTKRIYRKTRTGSLPELFAKYFTPRIGIEGLGEDDSL